MLNRIVNMLNKCGIKTWRAIEMKDDTAELYYIKKKLDIPRIKNITQYVVTVYNDFEKNGKKCRGESSALISPGMTDNDIEERIKTAYFSAGFVANPFYELADPVKEEKKESTSNMSGMDLKDAAIKTAEAMFSVDNAEDAFLNSVEIFAKRSYEHILTSRGTDVSFDFESVSGEFVTQCKTPVDVEQYRQFDYNGFEPEAVKEKVAAAIEDARARSRAKNMPKAGTYDIILTEENLEELYSFYLTRSAASAICAKYSTWEKGLNVQGEGVSGEKLNLVLEPVAPYSGEGIPLLRRQLIKDGELQLIHGGTRYCRYLGIEPTGDYQRLVCENGSVSVADMRKEGVLEPVSFSDFQMDPMDGHFKGEIRLAYLYKKDGTREELTGGSINGAFIDLQKRVVFSKEHYESLSYSGPLAILIPDVAVAGE